LQLPEPLLDMIAGLLRFTAKGHIGHQGVGQFAIGFGDLFEVDLPRPRTLDVMTTEKFGVYVRRIRKSLNAGGGLE